MRGLPQKHLTRGTPYLSTRTAVPASRIAGISLARPFTKPWLVTAVSERKMTGVRPATYVAMSSVRMESAAAHALALSGFAWRNWTMRAGSHTATLRVPP